MTIALAGGAMAQEAATYVYDVHGRLVSVARTNASGPDATSTYVYDPADNRSNRTIMVSLSRAANADAPAASEEGLGEIAAAERDRACPARPADAPADASADTCE